MIFMFKSLGKMTYVYRWIILALWGIASFLLILYAFKLPDVLSGDGFEMKGSYAKVQKIAKEEFNLPNNSVIVLFEKEEKVKEEAFRQFILKKLESVQNVEGLVSLISPYDQEGQLKGSVAFAVLGFDREFNDMGDILNELKMKLKSEDGIHIRLTGPALINEDMNKASQEDLKKAEMIGIPIALIVLLIAFGSFVAASVPIVIGLLAVSCSMGTLYFIAQQKELSIFTLNIVPMIGLALGIDFALIFISRFREELKSRDVKEAIVVTAQTAGRAILFSALCVILGLASMLVIDVEIFKTVAISGAVIVIFSLVIALTFLPALLSVIGRNINKLQVLEIKGSGEGVWHRFSKFVMNRAGILLLISFGILLFCSIPISKMKLSIPDATALPKEYDTRIAYEIYEKEFLGENHSEVLMIVRTKENDILEKESLRQLENLLQDLKKEEIVASVDSIFSIMGDLHYQQLYMLLHNDETKKKIAPFINKLVKGNQTIFTVHLNVDFDSEEAKEFVKRWEKNDGQIEVLLGGLPKFNQEIHDEISENFKYSLLIVFVSTFIILVLAFRSIVIPLKAIVMNIMSLMASFGLLVWIFQEGHFGFEPVPAIALMIPVFVFGVVFGLSMDYEVFLLSKIQEIYLKTNDNDRATIEGLSSTSRVITFAALIMIIVTGAFAFTGIVPVKQMGLGIALAIFIDATVVRLLLVPSLMKLMGDINWWAPKFLKKLQRANVFHEY